MLGYFLDASKAFDLVDHGKLFSKLLQKGLPPLIVLFLVNWYSLQRLKVRWGSSISDPFHVSNGVRQGSVLPPALFALYLMVCWKSCRNLVLVVIGVICLQEHSAMPMT